jgi:hypothetical protein
MLIYVLKLYEQGNTIAGIARYTGNDWQRIQRWIAKALPIREWLRQEYDNVFPCLVKNWTSFVRDFSWAFYPGRVK